MDLIEEYTNLGLHEPPISNTEIYKLNKLYSDILFVPPDIYRGFPVKVKETEKKTIIDIFRLTIKWHPYFIIKVEYS